MAETIYIKIKLEWNYVHRIVTLSIASYVRKAFHILQNNMRGGKEYSPNTCASIQYGLKVKYAKPLDAAEYLSDIETNLIQQLCVTFLYYVIAIVGIGTKKFYQKKSKAMDMRFYWIYRIIKQVPSLESHPKGH